jgi:hypothetical protein
LARVVRLATAGDSGVDLVAGGQAQAGDKRGGDLPRAGGGGGGGRGRPCIDDGGKRNAGQNYALIQLQADGEVGEEAGQPLLGNVSNKIGSERRTPSDVTSAGSGQKPKPGCTTDDATEDIKQGT